MKAAIKETLEDAGNLHAGGSWRSSVNRSYYAMFYTAQYYLHQRHADEAGQAKSHSGVATKFSQLAIIRGGLPRELGSALARVANMRTQCDYALGVFEPGKDEATQALTTARDFVATVLPAAEAP